MRMKCPNRSCPAKQKDVTVSVRKIENGFIIEKSFMNSKSEFVRQERFSESEPTIEVGDD